jgi:hypothetical protein
MQNATGVASEIIQSWRMDFTPDNSKLIVAGSVTPLDAKKYRLPKLF